ncbi:hypothetical protein [Gimesia chilikensis]|uniref:hypothetical protein n=1 Tax=Gimesia TaxID=1649453 RepID=UPI00119CC7BC|nr:hypothetical protein [Gimesia chilikensis]
MCGLNISRFIFYVKNIFNLPKKVGGLSAFSSECPSDLRNSDKVRFQIMIVSKMIGTFSLPNLMTLTADKRNGYGIEETPLVSPVVRVGTGIATDHAPPLITLENKPT